MVDSKKSTPPGDLPFLLTLFTVLFLFSSTFSIAASQTALTILFVLWLFYLTRGDVPRMARTNIDLAVLLFLASIAIAVIFSSDRYGSIIHMKNITLIGVVYLIAFLLRGAKKLELYIGVLLASAGGSALYGIVGFLLGKGKGTLGRTPGSFSTAMTFGGVMMILCSVAFGLSLSIGISRRIRVIALISTVLTAVALFFSFTRSSWLGMVTSGVLIVLLARKKLIFPFAAVLVLLLIIMPRPYRERAYSIFDPHYRTNVQRIELWKGGWAIFKDHPVTGVGTTDLAKIYERYKPPEAKFVFGHMHNDFLQIAVTMGMIGLAAFLFLLFSFYRVMVGNLLALPPPLERAVVVSSIGALSGFIVNGLFEWNFGDSEVVTLLYILVGFNVAFYLKRTEGNSSSI